MNYSEEIKEYKKFNLNNYLKMGKQEIEINYTKKTFEKYQDVVVYSPHFYSGDINYCKNTKITIEVPRSVKVMKIRDKGFKKFSDTKYSINFKMDNVYKYDKIAFDSNIILGEAKQEKYFKEGIIVNKQTYLKQVMKCSIVLTILLYIIYFIIKGKKVKTKEYRREVDNLISPVLAEAVIDVK